MRARGPIFWGFKSRYGPEGVRPPSVAHVRGVLYTETLRARFALRTEGFQLVSKQHKKKLLLAFRWETLLCYSVYEMRLTSIVDFS